MDRRHPLRGLVPVRLHAPSERDPRCCGDWAPRPRRAGAQAVAGDVVYLYRRRHEFGTFDEVRAVVAAAMATVAALVAINLVLPTRAVPASTPVIGGFFALVLMLGRRYVYRLRRESR